jgi:hypothetical protein
VLSWLDQRMSTPQVEPASPSWTLTKVVALVVAILSAGYMLPWAIAAIRDVPHWTVFWVNLLLGWTVVGWVVALVMSLRRQRLVIRGTG